MPPPGDAVVRPLLAALLAAALAACASAPRGPCNQAQPLGSVCGFDNPEDVAYSAASELLVVSQFRMLGRGGSLAGLTPGADAPRALWPSPDAVVEADGSLGETGCAAPDPALFHPHGIFVDARNDLYVVNHGGRESIEMFSIRGSGGAATLAWRGCIVLPDGAAGNDVAVGPDGSIVVSNYLPAVDSVWGNVKIGLGMRTGDVIRWRRDGGWAHVPNTGASAANGVALSFDGETLFYAETGASRLVRIRLDGSDRSEVGYRAVRTT
ncbi:MAG: SMP-30/gluconolactonase/LRE family protein [Thermodesulfobacteriota bacterium]